MKTTILSLTFLALGLFACGASEEEKQTDNTPPATSAAPEGTTPARTLVDSKAMGTRPDNLVLDPTYGSFEHPYRNAVYSTEDVAMRVETPATSPAGIAQNVLVARGSGMQPAVLLAVQGGSGPLDASVWIAVDEGRPDPAVTIVSLDGTTAFEVPSTKKTERHGEKTYKLYSTRIEQTALGKLYLMVEPGTDSITIAKPEVVVADPKKPQAKAHVVALSPGGKSAVRAFASRPIVPGPPTKNGLHTRAIRATSALR